ncbi:hypothetical protein [Jiangella asiatica]|uniref:Glycogen debranching protein n=1 Tax=Jiangella asiatica TaxID=2530372 RepID=A0A4V2Z2S8_9ACTN|nr:hypothetical protein [Jiangella asiatica]TDE09928.1 hypothetical protein E1269_13220 [Jiangella asiatica]
MTTAHAATDAFPRVDDLRSAPLRHRHGDVFNPPALTNYLGCLQADLDLTGIRSLNFAPYAHADTVTASLYLDGRYLPSYGEPITFTWRPDRVERSMTCSGLRLTSTTVLVPGRMAAVVLVTVENLGGADRSVELGLAVRSTIGATHEALTGWLPYHEGDNALDVDAARRVWVATARHSAAVAVQGVVAVDGRVETDAAPGRLTARLTLGPGGHPARTTVAYVHVMGADRAGCLAVYDDIARDPSGAVTRAERFWDDELAAVFTGGGRYTGRLPLLETSDDTLRRLYLTGIVGVMYFRRERPVAVLDPSYDTLMPRYWQTSTFLWDFSLSSIVHGLLDPEPMRRQLEHWMRTDVHTCMATESVTGAPIGMWYAVNDFAMIRSAREYLRWSGDHRWLRHRVGDGGTVWDHLAGYARAWRQFKTPGGLADYGALGNLLECVSSYVHEVAGLNAANVFNLRTAADIAEVIGDGSGAGVLRAEAADVLASLRELYVEGEGYWYARHPDGSKRPVRHCYDFATIGSLLGGDLSAEQRAQMTAFFQAELQTPTWLRALSSRDEDAVFSVRPDHQWNGAYTAWPSEAAMALIRMGRPEVAAEWMTGLARTARQGPFGQAHFDERVIDADGGGARKAPCEVPYISDWACSSHGSWVSLVLEGVFGVTADLAGTVSARPELVDRFDPQARLVGLACQGVDYTIDRGGAHRSSRA